MAREGASRSADLVPVRVFAAALIVLLVGYMFLGRGFAHLGVPPVYVGEVVLAIGIGAGAFALLRRTPVVAPRGILVLLGAFMFLGLLRTIPYLGVHGVDALRDGVLWGYALFALIVWFVVDRRWLLAGLRLYGWVLPIFALWLPIAWLAFGVVQHSINPDALGSTVPLLFFKNPDMAVHVTGAIAFLVLVAPSVTTLRTFVFRFAVAQSLVWTVFVTGTASRGALLAAASGLGLVALLAGRSRNWGPVLVATGVLLAALITPGLVTGPGDPSPSPSPTVAPTPSAEPSASPSSPPPPTPSPAPSRSPSPGATPTPSPGREVGLGQWFENIKSVFIPSSDGQLEGTKAFRLAWWSTIVDYTVFGPYFWTGKGFGVNLADDDGFQPTADRSLRAPHNSHISVLARMGVPGLILWALLQGAFAVGLLRSTLASRRAGDAALAAAGSWILVYWFAMMVNTSFDPYIEGPQGGIWFWVLVGLGLVVIRLAPHADRT